MRSDTIAAAATAMSNSGIGIIRISGDEAVEIADRLYCSKNDKKRLVNVKSHTIHYGFIYDGGVLLDEVMVSVMRAPNTYTREDVVEINCHGGALVMNKILDTLVRNGCRIAEAGEFTKRAFLNGRIDLSEAEAVMDIIQSKNEFALKSSVRQLKGAVSDKIAKLRSEILHEIAFIESALDDPEHISLDGFSAKLGGKTDRICGDLERLIGSADNGRVLKEGINTVIVGKPNVGKSSFLNLILGEDRAIVTSVAGTTRDVLEETVILNGISLNIVDTAGIRDTDDVVERIGVEKARKYANDADLVVYIADASRSLDDDDDEIIKLICGKKIIVLLNKTDLEQAVSEKDIEEKFCGRADKMTYMSENDFSVVRIIKTSVKEKKGIEEFENVIKEMFFNGDVDLNDEVYITNQRHKEALIEALDSMKLVRKSIDDDMPEDFYSIDLMSAYAALGRIIGEEVGDDLVEEIFSKFCVGK